MRIKFTRVVTVLIVVLNVVGIYFIWELVSRRHVDRAPPTQAPVIPRGKVGRTSIDDQIQENITVVLREFESFDNDIPNTIRSITSTYPKIKILIVSDFPPYPPLSFNTTSNLFLNVKHVYLHSSLNTTFESRHPTFNIVSKYVLFMPDSARIHTKKTLEKMVSAHANINGTMVAATFKATKPVSCFNLHLNLREWVASFDESPSNLCDFVKGKHAILLETQLLHTLSDPFMLPFPDAFFIQAAARGIKIHLMKELPFGSGKELYGHPHNQWKAQQLLKERTQNMFKTFGLKKVIRENGLVDWFGCRRDTPRCFGTVIDDTPQYLWEGKWTPPCCLAGLRRTARHVFQQLEQSKIRYWLEGGSLLGAIRSGDILPWDYDVDIGIYKEDINHCVWLLKAKVKPTIDEQGFVWEKATEGDFYRVHFSKINRLHVDIFPFYARNGTMTKDTWFKNHRQDMEFPEHFLKPLSTIDFVGRPVSAPNNIHDFLELKFGEGAIEHPAYPNPILMAGHGLKTGPDKA